MHHSILPFTAHTAQRMPESKFQFNADTADIIFQRQLESTDHLATQIHKVVVDLKREPRAQEKFKLAHLQKKLKAYQLITKVVTSNTTWLTQQVTEHDIQRLQHKLYQEMTLCLALMETAFKRMLSLPSDYFEKQSAKNDKLIFNKLHSSLKWVGGAGVGAISLVTPCCGLGVIAAVAAHALLYATIGLAIMTVDISIHNVSGPDGRLWPAPNQLDESRKKTNMHENLSQALGDMTKLFTVEFCELTSVPRDPCMVCLGYFDESEDAQDICGQGRHFMHKACLKKYYQRNHCLWCPMCGL